MIDKKPLYEPKYLKDLQRQIDLLLKKKELKEKRILNKLKRVFKL